MENRDFILVVENDPALRTVLEIALTQEGYEVDCAAGGPDAPSHCSERPADLVVLGADRPNEDGGAWAVRFRGRAIGPNTKVILMASCDDPDLPGKAARVGAGGVLLKPFSLANLLQTVTQCLAGVKGKSVASGVA